MTLGTKEILLLVALAGGLATIDTWSHRSSNACRQCMHPFAIERDDRPTFNTAERRPPIAQGAAFRSSASTSASVGDIQTNFVDGPPNAKADP